MRRSISDCAYCWATLCSCALKRCASSMYLNSHSEKQHTILHSVPNAKTQRPHIPNKRTDVVQTFIHTYPCG